jgi:hypothetical protein
VDDGYPFLLPLLLAAPLASVQLFYDARGESRTLWPELAGATALASVATSIALADGWKSVPAYGLWAVSIARALTACTVNTHRARLSSPGTSPPSPSSPLSLGPTPSLC